MPSKNKFLEVAEKVIREHPEMFEVLMEFERTKKLPKISRKDRANFTIDSNLLRKFKSYCKKNNINMSKLVEKHIKEELKLK